MLVVSEEVRNALTVGNVVALESTIITHGMPFPQNLETALLVEQTVRDNGAIPATIAIIDGVIRVGLSRKELEVLAKSHNAVKVSRRDISQTISRKQTGSTTVSATMIFAHMAGIRIFATGGIGGVHRGAESSWDISADITELSRTPVLVVCAGAKSILDLPRTLELLETGGVSVIGFKTNEFPAFFTPKSGLKTSASCDSEQQVAETLRTHINLNIGSGLLLTCPVPPDQAGNVDLIEAATEEAVAEAIRKKIKGKDITPFMLKYINEQTGGNSLRANIALIRNNAAIAARVAHSFSVVFKSRRVHVIGGICLDTIAVPEDVEVSGQTSSSFPGAIRSGIGGVCRNIATTVHQLSAQSVSFESCIGSDDSAATISVLREVSKNPWMSVRPIDGQRTAHYSAVMNGDGSLCSGIADMEIFNHFIPATNLSSNTKLIVLGANLCEKAIRTVCVSGASEIPVWVDCVSVPKCVRAVQSLPYISLVKANLDELATLAAVTPIDDPSVDWIARTVRTCMDQYGGTCFLVTCGRNGVFLISEKGPTEFFKVKLTDDSELTVKSIIRKEECLQLIQYTSPPIDQVVDSTGAGDSLLGATAWAHAVFGLPLYRAVVVGINAARMTLMSTSSVSSDITQDRMKPLLDQLHRPLSKL